MYAVQYYLEIRWRHCSLTTVKPCRVYSTCGAKTDDGISYDQLMCDEYYYGMDYGTIPAA